MPQSNGRKLLAALICYFLVLCLLAPLRPLWLDELIQLADVNGSTIAQTLDNVAHNPGGAPVAYLAENLAIHLFGHPLLTARLFPILCAVFALAGIIVIAASLRMRASAVCLSLIYCLLPLQLRYAMEARQYGPALAFGIVASALLLSLYRRPAHWKIALYCLVLTLGIYSNPYCAFVGIAHAMWAFTCIHEFGWKRTTPDLAAVALAMLLFLPWYVYAHSFWVAEIDREHYHSAISLKTPLLILRELSGGGYVLTLSIVLLAIYGYRHTTIVQPFKRLLLLWLLIPIPLAIAGDMALDYFFAIRQLLYVLPPLCLLAAEGASALPKRLAPALVVVALWGLYYDVRLFTHATEDWGKAASVAKQHLHPGGCLLTFPASAQKFYLLYRPDLAAHACRPSGAGSASIALLSPYATEVDRAAARKDLPQSHAIFAGGSTILVSN